MRIFDIKNFFYTSTHCLCKLYRIPHTLQYYICLLGETLHTCFLDLYYCYAKFASYLPHFVTQITWYPYNPIKFCYFYHVTVMWLLLTIKGRPFLHILLVLSWYQACSLCLLISRRCQLKSLRYSQKKLNKL